tara:strand:+ start:1172 stop:1810 length:639 start_codon:yes stop_codon:yes gene_type:complete
MLVDFIIDTICPWCYIGKRRFDRAFQSRSHIIPDIQYRPFLLNPEMPLSGIDKAISIKQKFGSKENYDKMIKNIEEVGISEGIKFNLKKIEKIPNSSFSHVLIQLAHTVGVHEKVVDDLLSNYFEQACDIGNLEVLKEIGMRSGLNTNEIDSAFTSENALAAVKTQSDQIRSLGVTGVPCYIFNKTQAISGAQEPEVLIKIIDLTEQHPKTN